MKSAYELGKIITLIYPRHQDPVDVFNSYEQLGDNCYWGGILLIYGLKLSLWQHPSGAVKRDFRT